MNAHYSIIAKQIGHVADDLMDNYLDYEWARYSLLVIASGIDETDIIHSQLKVLASDFSLKGDALALMLYQLAEKAFKMAKN